MRVEILSAADFLVQLLRIHHSKQKLKLSESQLEMFKRSLSEVLRRRYEEHWFPEKPTRGSAYRCLRINGKMDPAIEQASVATGIPISYLNKLFPTELTMWIDPCEVSYRIGENGSICVLYESTGDDLERVKSEDITVPNTVPWFEESLRQMEITPMGRGSQFVSS